MDHFYVACDLGSEVGRVTVGTLHKGKLAMSDARRFENVPVKEKDSLRWNIPHLYQETLEGLRGLSEYDEPVDSISCNSWPADYLLFEADGSLVAPTFHSADPRTQTGREKVLARIPWETLYDETGVQQTPPSTLVQLGAEPGRRLNRAVQLMPIADGFNFLLSGAPRIEVSQAAATQLYNPVTRCWSERVLNTFQLPGKLFPPVIPAGTELGPLDAEIARRTGLEDARVVASCSHELAAALTGLPVYRGEDWAFLRLGDRTEMGTELDEPIINNVGREWNFTHGIGYGSTIRFSKQTAGFWILEECRRFWKERDRALDDDVLNHLAIAAPPFESLINLGDPRFQTPGNMPLKIQAFCKETNQTVPRKPGPIIRCVLEGLALLYRKTLQEIEYLTRRNILRLYILGHSPGAFSSLFNHFTANALQIPVVIAPADATVIGNVIVQALALGHIKSLDQAREIVRNSFKTETIAPHAAVWNAAYDRLTELVTVPA